MSKKLLFASFLWLSVSLAVAQESDVYISSKYVMDQWGIKDGLPVNTVYDILKATNGYLWLTTHDGLVRFDGIDFKVYTSAEYPELRGNRIQYVAEAVDSSIFIQSEGINITKYKNGTFTHLLNLDIRLTGNGTSKGFYKDESNNIWFGGDNGIYVYKNGRIDPFEPKKISFPVTAINYANEDEVWFRSPKTHHTYRFYKGNLQIMATDDMGVAFDKTSDNIWLADQHNIYRFENEKIETVYTDSSLNFFSVAARANDALYISTHNDGLYLLVNGKAEKVPVNSEQTPSTFPFRRDQEGNFWTITSDELYKNGELILRENFLIEDIEFDEEGSIWIATSKKGLIRLKPKLFTTYSLAEGIPSQAIYPLFQSSDSSVWVGTFGKGLVRIKDEQVEGDYTLKNQTGTIFMQSFAEKSDGTLLLSALGYGLLTLDRENKNGVEYPAHPNLPSASIFSLFVDSKDRLWVGSSPVDDGGLYVEEFGNWTKVSGNFDFPYTKVRFMLESPEGDIWFATQGNGIVRYDNKRYHVYDINDGLSSNFPRALHLTSQPETGETVLWVGYEDKGIDRIELTGGFPDFRTVTNYQVKNGLFANSTHIILEDEQQRFWINTNQGIYWVSRAELDAFHQGKISSVYTRGYTEEDGLLNREGNGGIQPAGFKSFDGSIWFPSQDGVVSFHPDDIVSNHIIPPVEIQTITSNDKVVIPEKDHLVLAPENRDLEINYAALSFLNSEQNQYRYILEGYDKTWNEVGNRTTAYYTNLKAGTYTFRILGSNNEGVWNSQGATLYVTVRPFFYETFWFYLFITGIVALGMFIIARLRKQGFIRREEQLQQEVNNRTKELLEEKNKTELQAKKLQEMDETKSRFFINISHELRTPLTLIMGPLERLISGQIEPGSARAEEEKRLMLRNSNRLLRLIDQMMDVSKLESGNESIKYEPVSIALFLEKNIRLFQEAIDAKKIKFNYTDKVYTGEIFIDTDKIEKAIGNLLCNAIKFTPEGGRISVHLQEEKNTYKIQIKDNGIGIDRHFLPKIFDRFYQVESRDTRTSEGFGIGLSITKELVELHAGIIEVDSEPGFGTSFTITLLKGSEHFTEAKVPAARLASSKSDTNSHSTIIEDLIDNDTAHVPVNRKEDATTIIVVDDHPDMRMYISSLLLDDYKVIEAANGGEAYEKITTSPPDLIIADIMMPEMDGMQLNRLLKQNPITSSVPLIFLTARHDKQNRVRGIHEGADVYLTKPFNAEELLANVKNLLKSRLRLREQIIEDLSKIPQPLLTKKVSKPDQFLNELYEVLEEEFSNPELSVHMIQERMFMSRSSFYRTINEKTGMNTQQFINAYRLDKSREMLINDEGNISEIAYACGFNSLSYFSRSFKDKFGKTPSEFLKIHSL